MLRRALTSAMAMSVSGRTTWEVLVVDNNSKDQTREVTAEFCNRYPGRVRYLFESQPGKSHALNAGIRAADGDIVAFMDDDVTVDPSWLEELTAPLEHAQWSGSGGRIFTKWEAPPPEWLCTTERYALAPLVMFDLGPKPGDLSETPFGTNMAFRRCMFEKHGWFRTDLGPRPDSEIRNEDTEFGSRILAAGERLRYVPSAVVYHPVPEKRVTKEYFIAWWYGKGRGDIRQCGVHPNTRFFVAGIPLYMFRHLALSTLRWSFAISSRRRFFNKLALCYELGEIVECYSQARLGNKSYRRPNSYSYTVELDWGPSEAQQRTAVE